MGFPQLAAFATGTTFEETTHEFDLPDDILPGQIIAIALCMDDPDDTGELTLDDPGDWEILIDNEPLGGFGANVEMKGTFAQRIADGSETTISMTTTNPESVAYIGMRITDFDAATPIEFAGPVTFASAFDPPSLTPSWGAEDTLWIELVFIDPGYAFATVASTGYENFVESHLEHNDAVAVAIATRENAAVSEDPGVMDFVGFPTLGFYTLAVRPGTDGPGPLAFSPRLTGGADQDDPTLSIGGVESSVSAGADLLDDIVNAERIAGLVDYRCITFHNDDIAEGGVTALVTDGTALAIGVATEAAGETVAAIANDTTAPAGVVFSTDEVDLGSIDPGDGRGLWVRRTIDPDSAVDPANPWGITFEVTRVGSLFPTTETLSGDFAVLAAAPDVFVWDSNNEPQPVATRAWTGSDWFPPL